MSIKQKPRVDYKPPFWEMDPRERRKSNLIERQIDRNFIHVSGGRQPRNRPSTNGGHLKANNNIKKPIYKVIEQSYVAQ